MALAAGGVLTGRRGHAIGGANDARRNLRDLGTIAVAVLIAMTVVVATAPAARAQSAPPARSDSSAGGHDPHAVQPERPTVATHAHTVAPGWFEVETGVERDQSAGATSLVEPSTLKLGLTNDTQLSLFGPFVRPAGTPAGIGDWSVGVKWRLLDDALVVGDFALMPAVTFPTGSSSGGRGTGTTGASLLLISSHDFGDYSIDLNVGYTRRSGGGQAAPVNATLWTASFGGPLAGALGWTAECYGYPATSGPAARSSIVALLGGPTYLAKPWLAFDTGIIVPLTGPQPHAVYAGATYNIGRLWGSVR
jgi:hypothetical protein